MNEEKFIEMEKIMKDLGKFYFIYIYIYMFILQSMLVSLPIVVNINTIQDESNWCLTPLSTIFQILFYMNYVIKIKHYGFLYACLETGCIM
jgi:hypothetical protein